MREMDRAQLRQPVAFAEMNGGGLVFPDPVERHNDRALEGRGKKCRGSVRAVMPGVFDRPAEAKMLADLRVNRQLVVNEARNVLCEHAARPRPAVDHLIPQPAQFQRGVLVKHDPVNVVDADPAECERMPNRQDRKPSVVLNPAQPLFVDGELYVVFIEHRDGAVVVITRNPHRQHVSARHSRQSIPTGAGATGAPASMARAASRSGAGDTAAATPQPCYASG